MDEIKGYTDYKTERTIYLPIGGLSFHFTDPIKIEDLTFIKITGDELRTVTDSIDSTIKLMKHSAEEKEIFIQEEKVFIANNISERVCAVRTVIAEQKKAYELTVDATNRSLEVLRYAIPAFHNPISTRVELGLLGDVVTVNRKALILSSDGYGKQMELPCQYLTLTSGSQEELERIGVFKLSKILSKEENQKTQFEKNILRFSHWISDSHIQIGLENKLLSLMIALETIFGSGKNAIGFGVAIIVGNKLESRRNLKKKISEICKLRNDVVHGGKNPEVKEYNIMFLLELTIQIMLKLLQLSNDGIVKSNSDLKHLIETRQLSPISELPDLT